MKWLVVLCLLASDAVAATTWSLTTLTGDSFRVDVTATATGYRATMRERRNLFQTSWNALRCPGNAGEMQVGETLLEMTRQRDGTFAVTLKKAVLYPVGPSGALGATPASACVLEDRRYTGSFIDRTAALAADQRQTERFDRTQQDFLLLDPGTLAQGCPVPPSAKHTCMTVWPFKIIVGAPLVDSDGDAIPDEWEIGGVPHGDAKLDIKAMGAKPDHKDLFIQVDATAETAIPDDALEEIRTVFDRLPVTNPDGYTGIRLHLDAGPNSVMDITTYRRWGALSRSTVLSVSDHFSSFSAGPCAGDLDEAPMRALYQQNLEAGRAKIFRYAAMVKHLGSADSCYSGMNWSIPSKYFVVADFSASGKFSTPMIVGTFLHELGHSLGLHHGGGDDTNYKPNYQSIMNYAYQFSGVWTRGQTSGTGIMGYSSVEPTPATTIDESTLAESTGFPLGSAVRNTLLMFECEHGTGLHATAPNVATDFDCDGDTTNPAPNDVTKVNGVGPLSLKTFNDVSHLYLPLDGGGSGAAGAVRETRTIPEALRDVGVLMKDKQPPQVKLTLRKQRGKRLATIKARDDVGLASARVTAGGKSTVVSLSTAKKLKRDATVSIDVALTGDVTVVVNDIADKTGTATAK